MGRSRWFFVFIIVGILLLLVGIATGVSSRSSTYKPLAKGTIAHYLSADGTGYLQLNGSRDLYIIQEGTFSPPINGINTFQDGDTVSLVIDPKSTANIDKTSVIGTHLVGTATNVVQIMMFDGTSGQPKTTYATNAYKQNHNGYTQNNWPIAGGVAFLGLLMAGGAFFMPSRKLQPAVAGTPATSSIAFDQRPIAQSSNFNAPFQGTPQYQNQSLLQRQSEPAQPWPANQQPASPAFSTTYGQPQPGLGLPMSAYQQSAAPAFSTNISPFGQPSAEQQLPPYQKPVTPFFGIKNTLQAQAPTQPTVEQQWSPYQRPATPFFGIKGTYNSQPGLPWLANQQPATPTPTANNNLTSQQPVEQNISPYQQPGVHSLGIKNQIKALPQRQSQSPSPSPQGQSGLLKRYGAANANTSPPQQPVPPTQLSTGLEPTQRAQPPRPQKYDEYGRTPQTHPYQ